MITPASTLESEPVDPREARAAQRRAAAERLRVIGMALSEAMLARVSEAMKAGEAVDTGAVALEYARLSRSVRQTLALEARFDAAGADLAKALADERTARRERAEQARADRIQFNFDCVEAAVGEAIAAETDRTGDEARAERLNERLLEQLEDPREEDEIADQPISALIARVCENLGVAVDWSLWEDEDWAVAEWRAGLVGSPYAASSHTPGRRDEPERPEASGPEEPGLREPPELPNAPEILRAAQTRPGALQEAALARGPPG